MQDAGQHLVISICPPLPNKDTPRMYVDRNESDYDSLVQDINTAYQDNPSRSLLIKGSKDLKWKEAYGVMSQSPKGE